MSVNINNSIQVTATVQSSLTFTIAGVASGAGNCPNSSAAGTADITTTSTSIPFGSMTVDTAKVGCQTLTVSTNAGGGYVTTVQQNQNLTSAAAKTIDAFKGSDGNTDTYVAPAIWVQPKNATPTTSVLLAMTLVPILVYTLLSLIPLPAIKPIPPLMKFLAPPVPSAVRQRSLVINWKSPICKKLGFIQIL